jgi:hypothetical protein
MAVQPSKQITGVDVADRQREKDKSDRQHYEVEHDHAPYSGLLPQSAMLDLIFKQTSLCGAQR